MYTATTTKNAVRLLATADRFNRLAKTASGVERMAWYRQKDRALDQAICQAPTEFVVDSVEQDDRLLLGLTHLPSGRRVHLVPYRLTLRAQIVLYRKAKKAGLQYNFLRLASNDVLPEGLADRLGLTAALAQGISAAGRNE